MSATDDIEAKQAATNRRKEARRTRDERIRKATVRLLMSTPDGRRFVWLKLEECHTFEQTYVIDSFDRTAFTEGQRSIGQRLFGEVQAYAVADFVRMLQENNPKVEELEDVRTPDAG